MRDSETIRSLSASKFPVVYEARVPYVVRGKAQTEGHSPVVSEGKRLYFPVVSEGNTCAIPVVSE